jgi:hypothetical protein
MSAAFGLGILIIALLLRIREEEPTPIEEISGQGESK